MISFESQIVRRIVGRFERGEHMHAGLTELAKEKCITAGWISALGAFEWVDLAEYDQEAQEYLPPKRIENCEILNLTGNLSFRRGETFAHVHASVSKDNGNGIDVFGGHVVDAKVFACEFQVQCYDDVVLGRAFDDATGLDLWTGDQAGRNTAEHDTAALARESEPALASAEAEAQSASVGGKGSGAGVSWAQVAQAAQTVSAVTGGNAPAPRATKKEQMPKRGDYIEHMSFGLCRVDGHGTDGAIILKLPNDPRRKKVRLDIFEVHGPRSENGKRVFVLRKRQ